MIPALDDFPPCVTRFPAGVKEFFCTKTGTRGSIFSIWPNEQKLCLRTFHARQRRCGARGAEGAGRMELAAALAFARIIREQKSDGN
jgi:hypothetical protein